MTDDDDPIDDAIPVAIAVAVPKREPADDPPAWSFALLRGRRVVVDANGFSYRGVLVGADESELYLKGELRWLVLPLATVRSVVPAPDKERPLGVAAPGFGDDE